MKKGKKTEDEKRLNNDVGRNSDAARETGSCERQEQVDDSRCTNPSSSNDDQTVTSCDKEEEPGLDQPAKVESGLDLPNDDENGENLSDVTNSVGAIELDEVDVESEAEAEEEDRLEGAVGGSRGLNFRSIAKQLIEEKALAMYINSNTQDTADDDDEGEGSRDEEIKTCFSCGKKKSSMKKCSSCQIATYCDRNCQKADWKRRHKKSCGNLKRFLANIPSDLITYRLIHGPLQIKLTMDGIQYPLEAMLADSLMFLSRRPTRFLLLEIIGKHPHFFRPGCIVQDVDGNKTHILFYTGPMHVRISIFPFPLPLEHFLTPGRFIWLIDPVWHHFLDGTVGIRIDHPDQFEIP